MRAGARAREGNHVHVTNLGILSIGRRIADPMGQPNSRETKDFIGDFAVTCPLPERE